MYYFALYMDFKIFGSHTIDGNKLSGTHPTYYIFYVLLLNHQIKFTVFPKINETSRFHLSGA